jgi:hypothetical protein
MYWRWRTGSAGLLCSDSQDQATRPGRIHEVSASLDAGARSSTRVDPVTVARSPTTATRHGVDSAPAAVICGSGRVVRYTPRPVWVIRAPAYRPSTSASVTSA